MLEFLPTPQALPENTSPELALQWLATHVDPIVRAAVAHCPYTPPAILEALSTDGEKAGDALRGVTVQQLVARNPNTPAEVLRRMAADSPVRFAVLTNPRCPRDLFDAAAPTDSLQVWFDEAISQNAWAPVDLLLRASQHEYHRVREKARASLRNMPSARWDLFTDEELGLLLSCEDAEIRRRAFDRVGQRVPSAPPAAVANAVAADERPASPENPAVPPYRARL